MELLIVLLLPFLAGVSLWGTQEPPVGGTRAKWTRRAALFLGCLLAAFLGWYMGDAATKLAAASQQQQQQQQHTAALNTNEALGLPEDVEVLEVLSPAIDSRPKLLARLANGLEVLAMQDATSLEAGTVHVAASLGGGVLREPLHLPGLSLLVAHCTFRGEGITTEVQTTDSQKPSPTKSEQPVEDQQEPEHSPLKKKRYESFVAFIRPLGASQKVHLSVADSETSIAFQVPLEGLATALSGFREALVAPELCSNDVDGALAELKQLQSSLQHQCAADYHCRRSAILRNHVLNPNHRANRFHRMGLEFLYALRAAQWRSHDLGAWHRRQRRHRRELEHQRQQPGSVAAGLSHSLQLSKHGQQQEAGKQRNQSGHAGLDGKLPSYWGGFERPRLVFVDEIGADVLTPDVDIAASGVIWRKHFYVPNAMKLVVVGPASPQDLVRLVQQTFGSMQANENLQPFDCRDTRTSDIEALNPQPSHFSAQWHSLAAGVYDSGTIGSRSTAGSGRRHKTVPSACPNPKQLTDTDFEGFRSGPSIRPLSSEPVARLRDLGRLVMMPPANRQSHIVEFIFIFEGDGRRRPPCKHPKLAASLLGWEGPGSGVAALRSLGLADSVEVSVALTACSMELRVTLSVPGGALKHSVIELAGQIFFTSLQLWKHVSVSNGGWEAVERRFQAEEVAFNLHHRLFPPKTPALSGLCSSAAYGEGVTTSVTLSPVPPEGLIRQACLPRMSAMQEAINLANGLQNGMGKSVFSEEWLVQKVSQAEFTDFLSLLTPSRMIVFLATPLISPLCTRSASLLRLPFSVVPLEEQWRTSWSSISSLSSEEAVRLGKKLGLYLPLQDPFLPVLNLQHSAPTRLLGTTRASDSGITGAKKSPAEDHPIEAITFAAGDICRRLCEAFIDRRNPQQIPKAYATFLVFPLLPGIPKTSSSSKSKRRRTRQRRLYERVKTLVALSLFVNTVIEMLSDTLVVAGLSGSTVSVNVELQLAAVKVHVEAASGSMAHLLSIIFLSIRLASTGTRGGYEGVEVLMPEFQSFFDCKAAANVNSPFCMRGLDAPIFRSVKHRTLLRVAAAEGGGWLGCIAAEMRDQLVRKGRAPRALVAEILATLTAADAEKAGALLKKRVFLQAFFAGDVSSSLGASWADAAATALGLKKEDVPPPLIPVSAAQPLPLNFLMEVQRRSMIMDRKSDRISSAHRAMPVPRIRVKVLADIDRAAACSPKEWNLGGTKPSREYFLHQGGVSQLHIQLGVLTPEQLAAVKVLELVLEEALRVHFCDQHKSCASTEIYLLSEGGFFSSLTVLVRGVDGGSRWEEAGDVLERFLFDLGGAPRVFRSSLATPWRERFHKAANGWFREISEDRGQGRVATSGGTSSKQVPFYLVDLLSDEALERHKRSLLESLRGADEFPLQTASDENAETGSSDTEGRGLTRHGRSPVEWLGPSRSVYADEIWKRRYDFRSIRKVLQASELLSPSGIRAFYVSEVLAAPWLMVEVEPYVPPWKPRSPEFVVYGHTQGTRGTAKSPLPASRRTSRRSSSFGYGSWIIETHPLWGLAGSWVQLDPHSAAAVGDAAAEAAAAAIADAEAGRRKPPPATWGLDQALPMLYREKTRNKPVLEHQSV